MMPPVDPVTEPDDDEFPEADEDSGITLEALHEELIASTEENRRGNRRVLEVLKNFGGLLDALSATSNDTHKAVRALPAITPNAPSAGNDLPHAWSLPLVELADRIDRVAHGFTRPPAARQPWWPEIGRAHV